MRNAKDELRLLLPNIFIKDLKNLANPAIPSLALSCLGRVLDSELADLLYKELFGLFTSNHAVIRRKTCALSVKFIIKANDDQVVKDLVPYLADRLGDTVPSVKATALSAIFEVSRLIPSQVMITIPQVFAML